MLAQRHAVGDAALLDHRRGNIVKLLVRGGIKVRWAQDIGDTLIGIIVEQDSAQHGSFCRQVVRGDNVRFGGVIVERHWLTILQMHAECAPQLTADRIESQKKPQLWIAAAF